MDSKRLSATGIGDAARMQERTWSVMGQPDLDSLVAPLPSNGANWIVLLNFFDFERSGFVSHDDWKRGLQCIGMDALADDEQRNLGRARPLQHRLNLALDKLAIGDADADAVGSLEPLSGHRQNRGVRLEVDLRAAPQRLEAPERNVLRRGARIVYRARRERQPGRGRRACSSARPRPMT